jgi:hypothetical protein
MSLSMRLARGTGPYRHFYSVIVWDAEQKPHGIGLPISVVSDPNAGFAEVGPAILQLRVLRQRVPSYVFS